MKCGHDKDKSCPVVRQKGVRKCWLVVGTFCGGKVQGDFLQKYKSCVECAYYNYVQVLGSGNSARRRNTG